MRHITTTLVSQPLRNYFHLAHAFTSVGAGILQNAAQFRWSFCPEAPLLSSNRRHYCFPPFSYYNLSTLKCGETKNCIYAPFTNTQEYQVPYRTLLFSCGESYYPNTTFMQRY